MRASLKTSFTAILWPLCAVLLSVLATGSIASAAEPPIRILAMGDSLMQGFGLPTGSEFPAQLERALKARGLNVVVVNAGVSGDTSAGGNARIDWSLTENPDAAIVEFGGNDALRGLPPAETEKNIDGMLSQLKAKKVPALLAGMMAPRNMGADYVREFDAIFPRQARKHGVLFYPFFFDGVVLDRSLMQNDGTHANEKGVVEIVRRMMPDVVKLVEQARAARAK